MMRTALETPDGRSGNRTPVLGNDDTDPLPPEPGFPNIYRTDRFACPLGGANRYTKNTYLTTRYRGPTMPMHNIS